MIYSTINSEAKLNIAACSSTDVKWGTASSRAGCLQWTVCQRTNDVLSLRVIPDVFRRDGEEDQREGYKLTESKPSSPDREEKEPVRSEGNPSPGAPGPLGAPPCEVHGRAAAGSAAGTAAGGVLDRRTRGAQKNMREILELGNNHAGFLSVSPPLHRGGSGEPIRQVLQRRRGKTLYQRILVH